MIMDFTLEKKVFINLDARLDRKEQATEQFRQHSLEVERYSAIPAAKVRNAHGYYTAGHYALALTNRLILREAAQLGAGSVLIFEDDVVLHPQLQERLALIELPEDWGLFYLGCTHHHRPEIVGPGLVKAGYALDTQRMLSTGSIFARFGNYCAGGSNLRGVILRPWMYC